jgi:hypothetical protein
MEAIKRVLRTSPPEIGCPMLYMGPDETDDLSYENIQAEVYAERVSQDQPHRDEENVHEEYRTVLLPSVGWS